MIDARAQQALIEAGRLYHDNDLDAAETICRRVLKGNKREIDPIQLLGLIAFKRNDFDHAMSCYRKCIGIRPKDPRFHYLTGKVHTIRGDLSKAVEAFDAALRCRHDYQPALAWKSVVLERRGDYDEARGLLGPFIKSGVEDAEMAETWARLELHARRPEAAVAIIDRQLQKPAVPPLSREVLAFLKGRAYEAAGEHDRAFEAYRVANDQLPANFDPVDYVRDVDTLIEAFSSTALAALPHGSDRSSLPVFIAGMPRSGTTLVEQIVDAAPGAHGAGEIKAMESIVASLPEALGSREPYPVCVGDLTQRVADRLARRYLADIRKLDRNASVVTNKSLENYRQLGVVALLLPGARVIHCRRDPMDTCLSCYCSHLMPKRHGYACDLGHVAIAYRQYERLMKHWREALDIPMLDVCYEQLIADPEGVSRQMVEFCGLDWDQRCLRPHESKRFAMTLSYDQVRRPIYASSVGRHQRFAKHLGPLREALGETTI